MNLTTFAWNVHDGRQNPDVGDGALGNGLIVVLDT